MRTLNALVIGTLLLRSAVAAETLPESASWKKIVLIGASVSAGFIKDEPLGGPHTEPFRLRRYFDAAITVPHEPIATFATTFLFMKPDEIARDQIQKALATEPDAILSADFLFWSCYGKLRDGETRTSRFERGLKHLEAITCPLVIGDIPDASEAKGGMLSDEEVPDLAEIEAANTRLRTWAGGRENVAIFPVAAFMKSANANEAITVRQTTLPAGSTRDLLQDDRLHPTKLGCSALALGLLDSLVKLDSRFSPAKVNWDLEAVKKAVAAEKSSPTAGGVKMEPVQTPEPVPSP